MYLLRLCRHYGHKSRRTWCRAPETTASLQQNGFAKFIYDVIWAIYLNSLLRYYYFRFLKTNVRHAKILLPVSIFTFASPSACHSAGLPSFVQIRPSVTELWRQIQYPSWRSQRRNTTSGFGFREFAHLKTSKSTCKPNFGEISKSTASPSTCHCASDYQFFVQIGPPAVEL